MARLLAAALLIPESLAKLVRLLFSTSADRPAKPLIACSTERDSASARAALVVGAYEDPGPVKARIALVAVS